MSISICRMTSSGRFRNPSERRKNRVETIPARVAVVKNTKGVAGGVEDGPGLRGNQNISTAARAKLPHLYSSDQGESWHDVLIARILLRESHGLLEASSIGK